MKLRHNRSREMECVVDAVYPVLDQGRVGRLTNRVKVTCGRTTWVKKARGGGLESCAHGEARLIRDGSGCENE
jgi:hypothetical protein